MDGTKRTAFMSALYFLDRTGHSALQSLPQDAVIQFCLEVAQENLRIGAGEAVQSKTIAEIADWFRWLLKP